MIALVLAHASVRHAHGAHPLCLSAPRFFVFVSGSFKFETKSTADTTGAIDDCTSALSALCAAACHAPRR